MKLTQRSVLKPREIVLRYYELIDANEFHLAVELFAPDIRYRRCQKLIVGKSALLEFYLCERELRGTHELNDIYLQGNTVIVQGRFGGKFKEGQLVQIGFADFFKINNSGQIDGRTTYTDRDKI